MKRVLIILIICFAFLTTIQAQMDNPLKQGMPNTVTLSNGEVIYDLNGEWDAHFDDDWVGTSKDIFKITQKGNKFEGVKLIGDEFVPKGAVAMKGELERDGFKSLNRLTGDGWSSATGKIGKKCNKIVIKTPVPSLGFTQILTLTRK